MPVPQGNRTNRTRDMFDEQTPTSTGEAPSTTRHKAKKMHPFFSERRWELKPDKGTAAQWPPNQEPDDTDTPIKQVLPAFTEGERYTHVLKIAIHLGASSTSPAVRQLAMNAMRTGLYEQAGKKARRALEEALTRASGIPKAAAMPYVVTHPKIKVASMNVAVITAAARLNLALDLAQRGIAIAVIQESRAASTSRTRVQDYILWCHGAKAGNWGVAVMVHVSLEHQVTIDPISERIAKVCWNPDGKNRLTVMNGYAPCKPTKDEATLYWTHMDTALTDANHTPCMLILQDANAKVSAKRLKAEGHQFLGADTDAPRTDRNGRHLLDMCGKHNLRILNFGAQAPTTDRNTYVPENSRGSITDYAAHRPALTSRVTKLQLTNPGVRATHKMITVTVEIRRTRPDKRNRETAEGTHDIPIRSPEEGKGSTGDTLFEKATTWGQSQKHKAQTRIRFAHDFLSTNSYRALQKSRKANRAGTANERRTMEQEANKAIREDRTKQFEKWIKEVTTTLSKGGIRAAFQAIRTITKPGSPRAFTSAKTAQVRFQKYVDLLGMRAPDANLGDTRMFGYGIPQHAHKDPDNHTIVTGDGSSRSELPNPISAAIVVSYKGAIIGGYGCADTMRYHDPIRAESLGLLLAMLVHENGSITYRTDHDIVAKRFANITTMAESNFDEIPDGDIWREIYRRLPASFVEVERIPRVQQQGEDAWLKAAHALAQRAHALTPGTFCHIHTEGTITQAQLHTPIPWDKTAPPPQVSADTTPTDEEVNWAIDRIPVYKAQGAEKVHNMTWKTTEGRAHIRAMVHEFWDTATFPHEALRTSFITLPKPNSEDTRGIALMNFIIKVVMGIIVRRTADCPLHSSQFGFRRARGCAQAIHIIRDFIARAHSGQHGAVVAFIDLTKAYDSIPRQNIPDLLRKYAFGQHTIDVIMAANEEQLEMHGPGGTLKFKPKKGVKQGCPLSPRIFNIALDFAMQQALPHMEPVHLDGETYHTLIYADDIVIFAPSPEAMTRNLEALRAACDNMNLKINLKKTEYMIVPPASTTAGTDTTKGYGTRQARKRERTETTDPLAYQAPLPTYLHPEPRRRRVTLRVPHTTNNPLKCPFNHNPPCPFIAPLGITAEYTKTCATLVRHVNGKMHKGNASTARSELYTYPPIPLPPPLQNNRPTPTVTTMAHANITIQDKEIKKVANFRYLGSMINESGNIRPELIARRAATARATNLLRRVWTAKKVRRWEKMKLVRTLIIPVATYGAETWTLTAADTAYAAATIMTAIRQAASQRAKHTDGKWKPGVPNAILRRYARIPHPATMFKIMRLRQLGATLRCEGAPQLRKTLRPRAPKTKTRGAANMTWHMQAELDLTDAHLSAEDAHDLRKWKAGMRSLVVAERKAATTDDDSVHSSDEHSDGPTDDGEDTAKERPGNI